jgi:hypothetical protein
MLANCSSGGGEAHPTRIAALLVAMTPLFMVLPRGTSGRQATDDARGLAGPAASRRWLGPPFGGARAWTLIGAAIVIPGSLAWSDPPTRDTRRVRSQR